MVRDLSEQDRAGGNDAVCFTAGPPGAYFGAGTVHAYLAADRPAPVVAAGISSGAVSAAALYKAYRDLDRERRRTVKPSMEEVESARWTWFRRYLEQITYAPLDFVWDAIPNPIDFFAQTMPVEDPSCPERLKTGETAARIQYHRLIRLGIWFSGLRVTVGDLADLVVRYVRFKERYALWPWQMAALFYRVTRVSVLIAWRTFTYPGWLWRPPVKEQRRARQRFRPSVLFGWPVWGSAVLWAAAMFVLPLALLVLGRYGLAAAAFAMALLAPAALLVGSFLTGSLRQLLRLGLRPMGLDRGLLHKYPLRRALVKLFEGELIERKSDDNVPSLLVVAAPINKRHNLSSSPGSNQQFWARTTARMQVAEALHTALSNPGLYAPDVYCRSEGAPIDHWLSPKVKGVDRLEMVDGSVIRTNPIPALFIWLRGRWNDRDSAARAEVARLFTEPGNPGCGLNIVYGVPLHPLSEEEAKPRETINVVENGFASLALERRRDTELESRQTEFMSEFEIHIRQRETKPPALPMFPILPNPIAPAGDITFENNLKPDRPTALKYVAEGCRRTLEALYTKKLSDSFLGQLDCHTLLSEVARERRGAITPEHPGLSEVCGACTKVLQGPTPPPAKSATCNYGLSPGELQAKFSSLSGVVADQPRIVFLASGGVFRGTFHAGVLAAMGVARVRPDLIVGASVGSIAGAALGAQTALNDAALARNHNHDLVRVFLQVDRQVALTKSLKNVTKLLGVRGRHVDVSPAMVRRLIAEGSRIDPAYAITGAPPLLIDAIANLFLLPHEITRIVAARFVAGHITEAMNLFWEGVQRETLRRLGIEECVMGADLLEQAAKRLLFPEKLPKSDHPSQPYLPQTAFFATATNVNRRMPVILGRDFPCEVPRYDFLEACLASSAFPVVFAPRSESDLIPGGGSTRTLFSDGGIFDNLPFFPAIMVLSEVQDAAGDGNPQQAYQDLRTRYENQAIIIAAALDSDFNGAEENADTLTLWDAASRLRANVKLHSFCQSAELVNKQIVRYLEAYEDCPGAVDAKFVNSIVPNCVLPILPTDPEHLNGTFAFSRSTGLKPERVMKSIADGCFRTLLELSDQPANERPESLKRALERARASRLMAEVRRVPEPAPVAGSTDCPYFRVDGQALACHFTQGSDPVPGVHTSCCGDATHRKPVLFTSPASQKA